MKNIHEQSTLYFINIIAKLSGLADINELEKIINQPINYNEKIKSIQKKHHINCKKKQTKNKDVFKISCPAILYNEQGEAFLLANRNNEQVLVQKFGNTPPPRSGISQSSNNNGVATGCMLVSNKGNLISPGFKWNF